MGQKRHSVEQMIAMLRRADVDLGDARKRRGFLAGIDVGTEPLESAKNTVECGSVENGFQSAQSANTLQKSSGIRVPQVSIAHALRSQR